VLELAAAERLELPALFEELTQLSAAWERAGDLVAYLAQFGTLTAAELSACDARAPAPLLAPSISDAGRLWNRLLNYWGRGFLGPQRRDDLGERLARVLARRIVVDHLLALDAPGQADPERYLSRLRFETVLRERHAKMLRAAVCRLLPSLEVHRERA
jgi:hypothetical protein